MYQPIQPHHLFHQAYEEKIHYKETVLPDLADVLVCMWESIAIDFSGTGQRRDHRRRSALI